MHPDAATFDDLHDRFHDGIYGRESDGEATACRPDPEARLEELAGAVGPLRRVVAAIAGRLVACEGWKRLGYARAGDYARERLGCSARLLQDWARVDCRLAALPALERSLVDGTLAWSKVRLLARFVGPDDEAAWIARAQVQPVRALERAVRVANREALGAGENGEAREEARAWARVPVSVAVAMKWQRLRGAALRVAGQRLPAEAVLEMVTAEVLSALPLRVDVSGVDALHLAEPVEVAEPVEMPEPTCPGAVHARAAGVSTAGLEPAPCDLPVFLRPLLAGLGAGGMAADPFELDARLRRAMRLEQRLEAEIGPLLRQVSSPDYEWRSGPASVTAFARESLGMSPRKLRALLRVERVGDVCPALRAAYRDGHLSWHQAQLLCRLLAHEAEGAWRERWVAFAQGVSVRRLEEAVEAALAARATSPEAWVRWRDEPEHCTWVEPVAAVVGDEPGDAGNAGDGGDGRRQVCAFPGVEESDEPGREGREDGCRITIVASAELAWLFRATLCSVRLAIEEETGRLPSEGRAFEAMLDHAAHSWQLDDPWLRRRRPEAVRIFERDGWRCTVPGCSSRRNLQAHHIEFRSQGGSDEDSNQTTLCAFHHLRGVHAGTIAVRGKAPDALVFELGCRAGRSPLARYRSGDRRVES